MAPYFMDRHDLVGETPEQIAQAHILDLNIQAKYGVKYLSYWYHFGASAGFCLVESPTAEAAEVVHRESHGLVANKIMEVDRDLIEAFLGRIKETRPGEAWEDFSFRTILCVDIDDAPGLARSLNDVEAMAAFREHDRVVLTSIDERGGWVTIRKVGRIMGSFPSVLGAVECALAISGSAPATVAPRLRIGLSGGEPITDQPDFFGPAVHEADWLSRTAKPAQILVSSLVRGLCEDSGFIFEELALPGAPGDDELTRVFAITEGKLLLQPHVSRGPPPGGYPSGLSSREVEVLALIASGKTNHEIADLLFISLNTVATHVRNILAKTDASNRAEAACYALRQRLV